ncbi:MAG: transporter substrate-binding protein, partial [Rhizobacter sp.]|nr:transporter substrate-binding protein [Rhizobacter sp.]
MIRRRQFTQWGLGGLLLPAARPSNAAAAWPTQPIKVVVPSAAGGLVDGMARTIGERISKPLGQPVVIDSRPGANGAIAAGVVAKAPADGYTLLYAVNSFVLAPLLMAKPGYDVFKDFVPVSLSNYGLLVFAVGKGVPANDMREFVAMARSKPGALSFGSAGQGSSGHLYGEKLMRDEGLQMTHVPYKGGAPLMTDILGGQVQGGFVTMGEALPHYNSGTAKLLGVFGTRRMPLAPKAPTFTEQGFAG